LPLWLGSSSRVREDLVSSSFGGGFALRHGRWKLEFTTTGDGMDEAYEQRRGGPRTEYRPAQLYDLEADPTESVNLIDEQPEVVRQLSLKMANMIAAGRSTPGRTRANAPAPEGDWFQTAWTESVG